MFPQAAINRGFTMSAIKLSREETKRFMKILSHPSKPNKRLKAAFHGYQKNTLLVNDET